MKREKTSKQDDGRPVVFPSLVYRCPGNHQCKGGTYSYKPVNDYEELAEAIKSGWHETLWDAINELD